MEEAFPDDESTAWVTKASGLPMGSMKGLRSLIRSGRRRGLDRSETVYRVYITTLLALFGFYLALGLVDDAPIDAGTTIWLRESGAGWIGLLAAMAIAAGLKSGAHGGPLVLDELDLHYFFLSPIPRMAVLRDPVRRLIGAASIISIVVGLAVGELASRRLPGSTAAWLIAVVIAMLALALAGTASALIAASYRLRPWLATTFEGGLVGWATLDVSRHARTAPTVLFGDLALWPIQHRPFAATAIGVVALGCVVGYRNIAGMSIERAHRRSRLIRQVRFALAQQDIRALILLRRQLGFERPRIRPLILIPPTKFEDRAPVLVRDARSYLRWPLPRITRVAALAVVNGIALAGAWEGTTAMFAAVGFLSYLAAIEVVEPFAQDLDHPRIVAATPRAAGAVALQHLWTAVIVMTAVSAVSGVTAALLTSSTSLLITAAIALIPAAVVAVAGAALSIKRIGSGNESALLVPAELAGPQAVFRLIWPPALATIGTLPVLRISRVTIDGDHGSNNAVTASILVALLGMATFMWVRWRDDLLATMAEAQSV